MKTEIEARNSPDTSDEKLLRVLENFLAVQEAEIIFNAIHDNQFEVTDIDRLLEEFTE